MRFLANENFPGAAVTALEAAGHDIVWVRIAAPGTTDSDVLAWAAREERVLLTLDKDFGELARGSALPRSCGVVLFRTPMPRPSDVGQQLAELITARDDWAGYFSVIEPGRVRIDRSGNTSSWWLRRALRANGCSAACLRACSARLESGGFPKRFG
jgi:predicted nuclease of predicted toxin-antitoxin system